MPIVKNRGDFVMFEGSLTVSGTGCLESVNGALKPQDYRGILERNKCPVPRKLCFSFISWVLQLNNDPHR